jgi:oxygen-independent coproporphyrinogen-3 oxidase
MSAPAPQSTPRSWYFHVPFCARKCEYCAFYSEAASGDQVNRYVSALLREMELVANPIRPDMRPRTVFFGGGTPSLLNLQQWERILGAMERHGLTGAAEWTVECNPATVSLDKAKLLRAFGVNRISMGVQSLDEALLDRLGRVHSREMVFKSFDTLRRAGFDNINVDLMFGIPGQTMATWQNTLNEALALGSEHLSCYEVIYEEDTPLFAQLQAGEFDVDEELACDMYEALIERAAGAGFQQYEIANFARSLRISSFKIEISNAESETATTDLKSIHPVLHPEIPAFACRHNINYWRGGSFYGLGPSATAYVAGVRTKNWSNTRLYCERLEGGQRAIESREELSPLARAGETAAFGLRMVAGWPFDEFRQATGHDLRREWSRDMNQLTGQGWGRLTSDRFQLTRQGLRFADAAAELFLR